jgi:rod shape-determining protein MreD
MIAVLRGPIPRVIAFGMVLLALQTTLFTDVRPAGVVIQIVLAFAAAAGAAGGPERGAIAGFVLGVMYDLGVGTPLGSSAITMGLAGVIAGSVKRVNLETRWWLAALFVMLGAALGELAVPVVRTFLGETDVFSERLVVIVPIVGVAAALVSPLLVPLGRWCLRVERAEWKAPPAT